MYVGLYRYMYIVHTCGVARGNTNLHACLDHIDWCISKHTGCSSNATDEECSNITNVFTVVSTLKPLLQAGVDEEPDGLVGALFDNGGCEPLVGTS